VALRLGDEAVVTERPLLETGDPRRLSGLAARACERPVVLDVLVCEDDVVHEHLDVRKRRNEGLRDLCFLGGLAAVDGDRAARREVAGDPRGIAAAPRFRVAAREVAYPV